MNNIEEYREFTINIIDQLNKIQTQYNPTNGDFMFDEIHLENDHKYILQLTVHFNNEWRIILNQEYYYKTYRDDIVFKCYDAFITNIFKHLLFSTREYSVKNIIKTINVFYESTKSND